LRLPKVLSRMRLRVVTKILGLVQYANSRMLTGTRNASNVVIQGEKMDMEKHGPTMKTRLLFTLVCLFSLTSFCLSQGKWKVAVDHDGKDMLGQQLAYKLKDGIDKSSSLLLVPRDEAILVIRILSLDIGTPDGETSICSVVYTYQFPTQSRIYFCNHSVYRFGKPKVDETVADILATTIENSENCLGSSWKTKE